MLEHFKCFNVSFRIHKLYTHVHVLLCVINRLSPNDHYSGRTAPLTPKRCILNICSTNIGTKYFKHGIYSPFFPLQNAVCFINLTYLVPVLFTFYIQSVLKLKKNNSGTKRLNKQLRVLKVLISATSSFVLVTPCLYSATLFCQWTDQYFASTV